MVIFVLSSVVLMFADHHGHYLRALRQHLAFLVYPIQYVMDLPVAGAQWLSESLSSRGRLLGVIERLRRGYKKYREHLQS